MATNAYSQDTIIKTVYDPNNEALQVNIVAGSLSASIDEVTIGGVATGVTLPVVIEDSDGHELAIGTDGSIDVNTTVNVGSVDISGVDSGVVLPMKLEDADGHELQINTDGSINVSGLSGSSTIAGIDSGVVLPVAVEDADGHALQINTDGSINVSGLSGDTNISGIDSGVTIPVSIADTVTVAISQAGDAHDVVIKDDDGHKLQINTDGSINVSGLSGDTNISGIDSGVTLPVSIADNINVNLQAGDGTGITQSGGNLDVNIAAQDNDLSVDIQGVSVTSNSLQTWLTGQAQNIDVDVQNRVGTPATAANKVSVPSLTSTQLIADDATRIQGVYLFNLGPDTCYIQINAAADEEDFPLLSYMGMMIPTTSDIRGYCESGDTADIRVMAI